jgi:general secretion pathway protein A
VLNGLTNTHAALQIGSETKIVSLNELSRFYRGRLLTFWQAPKSFREKVRIGYQGDDVNWLATQMAKLNGQPEPLANRAFNKGLSNQIYSFQQLHGLVTDGVVGPKTYMLINAAIGVNEPRLASNIDSINVPVKE